MWSEATQSISQTAMAESDHGKYLSKGSPICLIYFHDSRESGPVRNRREFSSPFAAFSQPSCGCCEELASGCRARLPQENPIRPQVG